MRQPHELPAVIIVSFQSLYLSLKVPILGNARTFSIISVDCGALQCQLIGPMREYSGVYQLNRISIFLKSRSNSNIASTLEKNKTQTYPVVQMFWVF